MAQKKPGSAAAVFDVNIHKLSQSPRKSPRRSPSPASSGKGKGKVSARDSEDEDDEDSGDEAEKLNDEQMNEIDTIYRK